MADPEKKEKSKKKKSVKKEKEEGGEKEKEGGGGGESLAPPEGGERKASLTPEPKEGEGKRSRKASAATDAPEKEKSKSRKTSAVEPPPAKAEAEEKKEEKKEEEDDEDDGEMPLMPAPDRVWDPDHIPFQAFLDAESIDVNKPAEYYCVPPEPDQTDIQLLQDLDTRRLAELMEAFAMFDFDQDGVISQQDLKRTFASLDRPDIDDEEVKQMISEGLNPLDFDAFVVLMGYKTLELDAEETLIDALSQWDYGTEGLISEERIRRAIMTHGDRFTEEEAAAALEDAPMVVTKNKEKMINYIKFSNDLCGLRKRMKQKQKEMESKQAS